MPAAPKIVAAVSTKIVFTRMMISTSVSAGIAIVQGERLNVDPSASSSGADSGEGDRLEVRPTVRNTSSAMVMAGTVVNIR